MGLIDWIFKKKPNIIVEEQTATIVSGAKELTKLRPVAVKRTVPPKNITLYISRVKTKVVIKEKPNDKRDSGSKI